MAGLLPLRTRHSGEQTVADRLFHRFTYSFNVYTQFSELDVRFPFAFRSHLFAKANGMRREGERQIGLCSRFESYDHFSAIYPFFLDLVAHVERQ